MTGGLRAGPGTAQAVVRLPPGALSSGQRYPADTV